MEGFADLIGDSHRRRSKIIEEMVEKSLLDPEKRGVMIVDHMTKMTTEVYLDSSVPFGMTYQKAVH